MMIDKTIPHIVKDQIIVIMIKNLEQAIREAAYYNWQNAGCPFGQDEKFWNMAIEQIYGSKATKSCCSTSSSSKKTASSSKKTTSSKKSKK